MPPSETPSEPGWYDDPDGNRQLQRRWDGEHWAGAPRQRPPELKWSGILVIIAGTIILTLMIALTTRSLL